jgi:hypothetical protein
LEDERDKEVLQGLQRKKNKNARLEWMYSAGPNTSQDIIAQDKEDYLLGKKKIDKIQNDEETKEQVIIYNIDASLFQGDFFYIWNSSKYNQRFSIKSKRRSLANVQEARTSRTRADVKESYHCQGNYKEEEESKDREKISFT